MMKKLSPALLFAMVCFLGLFLLPTKGHSQCTNCVSNYPSGTFSTTSASWTLVTNYQEDDEYTYYSLNSSYMYQWRTSYYSAESFDTELTLYPSATCGSGYHIAYDDDGSDGTYSCLNYSGTTTSVRVLCSYYACTTAAGRRVNHHWRAIPKNPTISGGGVTICNGQSVNLTAANIGNNDNWVRVYWGTTSGGTQVASDATSVNVSPTSTTTYYLRYVITGYNGESGNSGYQYSNIASTTITVRQPPTAPTGVSGTATICEGNNLNLTATGGSVGSGATYQWYADGCGSGSVLGTGSNINVTPSSTTTYYVRRVGNSPCNSTITTCANGTVNVNDLPTASAGGSQSICSNGTAAVTGASATDGTILWTEDGAGSITSGASTTSPVYTADAADAGNVVTLTMTVTSDNICAPQTAVDTYTVNVDPLPTASAGGSQTICSNGSAIVSGASYTNGTVLWTHDGDGTITNETTLTPTYNAVEADAGSDVVLTMTVTSDNACNPQSATATYTVTVDPSPIASAGGSQSICFNSSGIVSGASSSDGTVLWTHDGNGILIDVTSLTPTYTADALDEGNTVTLTLTVTSDNICNPQIDTDTYIFDVEVAPTATAGGSQTICSNGTAAVTGASASDGTILWTEDGAGSITSGASTTSPVYTADVVDAGNTVTLTMTVTSNNTCSPSTITATDTYTVDVDELPTASAGGSQTICSNGSAIVSGANATNGTVLWTHDGDGTISDETTLTPTYNAVVADANSDVVLTMTVTSDNACNPQTTAANYTVTVDPLPIASAGGNQSICFNSSGVVSGASATYGTASWTHDGNGILTDATTLTPTYTADALDEGNAVILTLIVTSDNTCNPQIDTDTYTFDVEVAPTATAGGSQTICSDGTAAVTGASATDGTILWTEDGAGSITSGASTTSPVYTADAADAGNTVTLTMTVTSDNTCSPSTVTATDTYTVDVDEFPTANAGGSQTICSNGSAMVSGASVTNGTVVWIHDGDGTISDETTLTPIYNAVAADANSDVILTMTVTSDNACNPQTTTADYTVTVDPLPIVSAGGSQSICFNSSGIVSGASATNGTPSWTHDGNGTLTDETTFTPTYTAEALDEGNTVTLTLTANSDNTCNPQIATDTYTFDVDVAPVATAGGTQTICSNGTAIISGASASNGTILWTHDGDGIIVDATTLTPTYIATTVDENSSVILTMTVTSDNTCNPAIAIANFTVVVDPLPVATAGGNQEICPGLQTIISGATSSNGTVFWTHDGSGTITDETTLTPTYNSDLADEGKTVILTMTVTSDNTCNPQFATDTYSISITELPIAPTLLATDNNDFCNDDAGTINLSVAGGIGDEVHWFDDACGGNEIGIGNPLNIESPTVSTTYYARWENTCDVSGCSDLAINVVEPPVVPTEVLSNMDDFCADDAGDIELSITGGYGTTVQWFTGSCGGASIGTGNPLIIPSPDVSTEYFARWENACGESSCVSLMVKVNPLPIAPTQALADRTDFCSDDLGVIELSVSGGLGTDVVWFTESCGGNMVGTGNPLTVASPSVSTTYYGRWESSCGITSCESVLVNVISPAEAPAFVSTDANNICTDDAGTINLSSVGGSGETLTWYIGSCQGTAIGTTNPINIESPTETTEYFVSWENLCGISDCESVVVTVIDAPTDPTSAEVDINDICENDAGDITLSITGGVGPEVYWYSGSCGGTFVGTGSPLTIESPSIITTYFARYESFCGNSNCVEVTVNVTALPTSPISAESDLNNICANDDGNIALSVTGGSGDEVHWFDDACDGNEIGVGNPLIISSPEINTTYYARWENSCGESTCKNVTLITVASSDATINPAGPFCETDGVVVITAAEAGGTWAGIGIDPLTGLFDPAVAGVGDHLISYTIMGTCGDLDEATILVVNSFDPTIDAVADLCTDDIAITLTAADNGGTWSGTGIVDTENGFFDPAVAGDGVHTITYGSVGGCGGTDDVAITVNSAADATITPVGPFCETDDPVLVIAAQVGGTWAGTFIDPVTGSFDPEIAGPGDHLITYAITGDCDDNDEFTIIVLPILDPTIDALTDLCESDTELTLTATDIGGEWSGIGITDSGLGTFDPTIAGVGTHTITYTFTGTCGSSDDIDITVNPSADATINLVGEFCENDSPLVLTANQFGGTWSGNGVDPVSGFFNPTTAGSGDHLISYTIVGDCGDTDAITITVLPSLDPTIDPVDEICSDVSPITLTAVDLGGIWSGDGITDESFGTFDPADAGEGVHTITYTFGGSCGSSDDIIIIVNLGADATITPVGPFCVTDDSFVLTAAQVGGTWSGSTINPVTGFFDPEVAGPGDHLITYTIIGDCEDTDQITIVVQDIFDATIDAVDDICSNAESINLSAADTGGIWSGDGIIDENTGTFDPSVAGVGNHMITYTFVGDCGVSDDIEITVIQSVDATINLVNPICEGTDAFFVTAAETGGEWSGAGINATTGFFDPEIAGVGTHTITYTITGDCEDSDNIDIIIEPLFDATITGTLEHCISDSFTNLVANTDGGAWTLDGAEESDGQFSLQLIGAGTHEVIYFYDGLCADADTVNIIVLEDADATITAVDTLNDEDLPVQLIVAESGGAWTGIYVDLAGIFDPASAGTAVHEVIYTISGQCGDIDTLNIVVIDAPIADLLVATVLTPDNDGYNDTWRIQGIEAYQNVSIRIFTRWGDEVFVFDGTGESYEDLNNQWNGKSKDKDLPTGSYMYVLILGDEDVHKGTISLIR